MKKIAIASDHAGFAMKEALKKAFADRFEWVDLGTLSEESTSYADYGQKLGEAISNGDVESGIAVCGTGIGISIAVNRFAKVRAALCTNTTMARFSRQHNDANVLVMGSRIIGIEMAKDCVEIFFSTAFEGGRHEVRVKSLCKGI